MEESTARTCVMGERRPGDTGLGRRARGEVASGLLGERVQPTPRFDVTALFEVLEHTGDTVNATGRGPEGSVTRDPAGQLTEGLPDGDPRPNAPGRVHAAAAPRGATLPASVRLGEGGAMGAAVA